jgi:hypothetical protein
MLYEIPKEVMKEVLKKNLSNDQSQLDTINKLNDWEVESILLEMNDSRMIIHGTNGERITLNAIH